MSTFPAQLKYTVEHEWLAEGDPATIGITDTATEALGDVVYLELPAVGEEIRAGGVVGEIESTKSVSELFSPVTGTVVEVNAAFTDILGHGPEGLPYPVPHPWWPDERTDPEAHRQFADAFEARSGRDQRSHTVPVTHRDGRRLWVSALMNPARDPDSGRIAVAPG